MWPILINHIGPIKTPFAKTDLGPYKEPTKAPYKNPFGTLVGLICSAGWVMADELSDYTRRFDPLDVLTYFFPIGFDSILR